MLEGNITNGLVGIENMGLATKIMPIAVIIKKLWSFLYEKWQPFLKFKMAAMTMLKKMEPSFFGFAIPEMTNQFRQAYLKHPEIWTLDSGL